LSSPRTCLCDRVTLVGGHAHSHEHHEHGGGNVTIPQGAQVLGSSAYAPNPITLPVGTMVTWTNTDSTAHTATSNTGAFNSGTIAPGRSFSFTFQTAGTYPYHCNFHSGMVGSVVVQ